MDTPNESPIFDSNDNTALVCIDQQQYQKIVVPQLIDVGYKVHLGLFEEDVLLKLRTYDYNVVVVYENFKGSKLENNPILGYLASQPGPQRRKHFVVLVSHRFPTNDAMSAFAQSVDQIVNITDLANFKPVLRRGFAQYRELYRPFIEASQAVRGA